MKRTYLLIFVLSLLLCACEESEYTTQITGTLYTDSTLTTPVANDTLWFCNYRHQLEYTDSTQSNIIIDSIGHCLTDAQGRFGFSFWNIDVNHLIDANDEKFQFEFAPFLILYKQDTLFSGFYHSNYRDLLLYIGRPYYLMYK